MAYFEVKHPVNLKDVIASAHNVAEILNAEDLDAMGLCVKQGFDADERTRDGWVQQQDEMLKLALQVYEKKNTPWPNAANIKYPLLTLAAIRYAATAYPALVDSINPVKFLVKGEDETGAKERRSIRLGYHMSYQLIEQMDNWEGDMDKGLFITSILGCVFKKIYHDAVEGKNKVDLVLPKDLVVDYWTKDLKTSRRYTHVMEVDSNYFYEQVAAGVFLDINIEEGPSQKAIDRANMLVARASGEALGSEQTYTDTPKILLEQHTYFDLDGDGYKEPYVVSVEYSSGKVFRVVPRFDADTVMVNSKTGKIMRIEPEEYFQKIPFIPSPDGSFYDIGFGVLLGSINRASNTIINQLIDAGTLSNRQSGFLAKGIRIKGGDARFKPGEWKFVETVANDLRAGIVPLPAKEPSTVLYNLVQFLIDAGNKLGSTVDMMVGENPGQNQPATTTMAVLEQGLKVFIAIHKRQFKALKEEYQKLYVLNTKYLDINEYISFIDPPQELLDEVKNDYTGPADDVRPNADTSVITEAQRITKAQALLQLLPMGINQQEVVKRVLISQKQENIEALLAPNPPGPPDPKAILAQAKAQEVQQKAIGMGAELALKHLTEEGKATLDSTTSLKNLAQARLFTAQANTTDHSATLNEMEAHLNVFKAMTEREEMEEQKEAAQQSGQPETMAHDDSQGQ